MSERFMTMVALASKTPQLDWASLKTAVYDLSGLFKYDFTVLNGGEADGVPDGPILARCNGVTVSLLLIDEPIPAGALAEAYAESDFVWSGGKDIFQKHKSHIIVVPLDEPKDRAETLRAVYATTCITGAICTLTDAIGVYWENAETISNSKAAIVAAMELPKGQLPLLQWVRPSVRYSTDGKQVGIFTQGLRMFSGREIEFPPSDLPAAIVGQRVLTLAEYLISRGPIVNDGDTVGTDKDERIRVKFADRGLRPGIPVMILAKE